jgi:hypothetical protein
MTGRLMNNDLQNIWKELAVAWFKALFRNLTGVTEEDHDNPSVSIADDRVEILTRDLRNMKQEC